LALLAVGAPVAVQLQSVLDPGKAPDQSITHRADIFVSLRVANEVSPVKTIVMGGPGGHGFCHHGTDVCILAGKYLFTLEMYSISCMRRFSLALVKFLSRLLAALNLLPSIATVASANSPNSRHGTTNCRQTPRMPLPLSLQSWRWF